ncbi:unnamed protein product, partial [Phaedon cochleariae]
NERLLKKLEEVNSSPLIPARPAFSAEILNSSDNQGANIWTNPIPDKSPVNSSNQIPDHIRKELDKRQIGNGNHGMKNHRRPSSLEEKTNATRTVRLKTSDSADDNTQKYGSDTHEANKDLMQRRFSVANPSMMKRPEIFGSVISLTDEDELN